MNAPDQVLSFHWLDGIIILVYLSSLVGIGFYHSRRQKNLKDFFLAGKTVKWIPMGLSLMAALNSGIDYLMQPSGVLKFGIVLLVANLSWLFLYPYVFYVTLPLFRRLNVYSAYQYLEHRFDVSVRCLTAGIFMLWRFSWMATALYVPCLAITTATGHPDYLVPAIITLGALVTLYTMLGGIKAIIWTDVMQFCVMFGGLAVTLLVILFNVKGGLGAILTDATTVGEASLHQGNVSTGGFFGYFFIPIPMFGFLLATLVTRVTNYTSDQVMVQRFQTTNTIKESRQGFVLTAIGDTVWMTVLIFVGVALFTYFKQIGGMPPWLEDKQDQVFPYFMGAVFPAGLTGLVIAAIMAASLSSIDSAINSLTSVATVDFYQRLYLGRKHETGEVTQAPQKQQVLVSRILTIAIGSIGILLACNVSKLGTIFEISNKLINGFTGPILGIFFLGMFTRKATSRSVFVGGVLGTLMSIYTIFWSSPELVASLGIQGLFPVATPVEGTVAEGASAIRAISFLWPSTFGFLACFGFGYVTSLFFRSTGTEKERAETWNWFTVTRTELIED